MKKLTSNTRLAAWIVAAALILAGAAASAQPTASFETEFGAFKLLSHTYRVGAAPAATDFDFVNQGGQEILFPFGRLTAAVELGGRHELRFLYQPLELATEVDFESAVTIDGRSFTGPTRMTYGFPFYRLTYQYRFLSGEESWLAGGAALQMRNASIRFASLDGATLAVSQNLGFVPALALSGRAALGRSWFAGFEATGLYASSAFINGADFEFEGSILDASARLGFAMAEDREVFLNLRYFGGTAAGISQYERAAWSNSDSPETDNRISALSLTIGATLR